MTLSEVVDYIRTVIFKATKVRTMWEGFAHKKPDEAYMTVEVIEPYLPWSENKEHKNVATSEGLERHTKDTFESVMQFKVYVNNEKEVLDTYQKVNRYFAYKGRTDLQKIDVAYVDMSALRGLMSFEEDDKEVIKTFDLKIRMTDVIVDDLDWFNKIDANINDVEVEIRRDEG